MREWTSSVLSLGEEWGGNGREEGKEREGGRREQKDNKENNLRWEDCKDEEYRESMDKCFMYIRTIMIAQVMILKNITMQVYLHDIVASD